MQQVKADSGDAVKMGPGTLYGSLDRMIEPGLVAKGNTQDPRRIYYRLTALGQIALRGNGAAVARGPRCAPTAREAPGAMARLKNYVSRSKILCFVAAIMLFVLRADREVSGART
jgi:DNA-binding PadR family transcriptional regulator